MLSIITQWEIKNINKMKLLRWIQSSNKNNVVHCYLESLW